MKNNVLITFLFVAILGLSSCNDNKGPGDALASESSAVCIFDKTPVYDESGKYISSLALGERVEAKGEEREITIKNKKNIYFGVKMSDGKKGWVQHNLIVKGAIPAVIVKTAELYKRPDLKSGTSTTFEPMDIIAIKSQDGDWIEVTGKRRDGKWTESAWLKAGPYSDAEKDIAVAVFIKRAMSASTNADKLEALMKIRTNSDFSGSVFERELVDAIEELHTPPANEPAEKHPEDEELEEITG